LEPSLIKAAERQYQSRKIDLPVAWEVAGAPGTKVNLGEDENAGA